MNKVYEAEELIDASALINALDEIEKDETNKTTLRKSYDPHIKIEQLAKEIDIADKESDKTSLGISAMLFSFLPLFIGLFFLEYTTFEFVAPFAFLFCIIVSIISTVISLKKHKKQSNNLFGHRVSYIDKMNLEKLYEERKKKNTFGIFVMVISIFVAIFNIALIDSLGISEYIFMSGFFSAIGIGLYALLRNSYRLSNLKQVVKSLQQ